MSRFYLLLFALTIAFSGCTQSGPAERTLGINVRGSVSVTPTDFSGYYIYENNAGEAVRRTLTGSGNFNEVLSGRRVLRVAVRRTSPAGVIGLVVTSNGDIVYDSGMLQTNELILYDVDS